MLDYTDKNNVYVYACACDCKDCREFHDDHLHLRESDLLTRDCANGCECDAEIRYENLLFLVACKELLI